MNMPPAGIPARSGRMTIALVLASMVSLGAEDPLPFAPLPPRPVLLPVQPEAEQARTDRVIVPLDKQALAADLTLIAELRQRLRRRLLEGGISGVSQGEIDDELAVNEPAAAPQMVDDGAGTPVKSTRIEGLTVTSFPSGAQRVSASVAREQVQDIYAELTYLLRKEYDDQTVPEARRRVAFHVQDAPWDQALTALLGQAGLGWRGDSSGKIIIEPLDKLRRDATEWQRLAGASYTAASIGKDAVAAEAVWRLGRQEQEAGRPLTAKRRYEALIERFHESTEPEVAQWVRRAWLGYAEVLKGIGEWREARTLYRTAIAGTPADDPDLPRTRLAAVECSLELAKAVPGRSVDPDARDLARDMLERLIQDHGTEPAHHATVVRARRLLSDILLEDGAYAAAHAVLTAIQLMQQQAGLPAGDAIQMGLARCDYELGRRAIADQRRAEGEARLASARAMFTTLASHGRSGRKEPDAPTDLYAEAGYLAGLCALDSSRPQLVEGLIDLLRARSMVPDSALALKLRILARIIRCYAELQRDELLVREFFTLLEGGQDLVKSGGSQALMDDILGQALVGGQDGFSGDERSRILIDIAEARWREAQWNVPARAGLLSKAIAGFQRVETETGERLDPELRQVVRIGLARACLLGGTDIARGEQVLTELIQVRDQHPREAALALKLLLEHYRSQGRYDEALREYQAYIGEGGK